MKFGQVLATVNLCIFKRALVINYKEKSAEQGTMHIIKATSQYTLWQGPPLHSLSS
jgi:hypothetical protein